MLALVLSAALATPQAATVPARKAYGVCLNKLIQAKADEHLSPDAFQAAARSGCAPEAAAFATAWVAYDVSMRTRRADAEENARAQIEDYLANAVETYTAGIAPR